MTQYLQGFDENVYAFSTHSRWYALYGSNDCFKMEIQRHTMMEEGLIFQGSFFSHVFLMKQHVTVVDRLGDSNLGTSIGSQVSLSVS